MIYIYIIYIYIFFKGSSKHLEVFSLRIRCVASLRCLKRGETCWILSRLSHLKFLLSLWVFRDRSISEVFCLERFKATFRIFFSSSLFTFLFLLLFFFLFCRTSTWFRPRPWFPPSVWETLWLNALKTAGPDRASRRRWELVDVVVFLG